jgi:predicted NUDIX family NTP pyrophosphohydrolase
MTKAYSYARWSDPRQGKGDSEDRQLSAAREYAAEHGLVLDAIPISKPGTTAFALSASTLFRLREVSTAWPVTWPTKAFSPAALG